ncbi:HtaA domain-containing protein [Conexibacter sp. CPCC 206217]|uniref:HtaA domain-containing protein n=1 Tax=Conexibacter sp. CPCC 206217 TaxID=3064574 RepID=UPI002726B0CE|nr:HtaA domain-containing protein [Conexibacter sp. CPCC 206217]MDO8208772.1 HtaA domain-containing protein [Conexibacter sp. CPCC 206217]
MHSAIRRTRRGALALGALLTLAAAPGVAQGATVEDGWADWGVEQGLRDTFVPASLYHRIWSPATASPLDGDIFRFPVDAAAATSYTYDARRPTADAGTIETDGGVEIGYHLGAPRPGNAYGIWVNFQDLEIALDGRGGGTLTAVTEAGFHGSDPTPRVERTFATIDLTAGTRTYNPATRTVTWSDVPTTLTAAGEEIGNGTYLSGDPLDPISFSVELG